MVKQVKCVYCKATEHIRWGTRKTQNRGVIQKFKCLSCGKYFTQDDGFYRMRNSPEKITAGIDLYFSNLSSRKVRNHFRRHWEHNASHVTVLDWCRKYTLKVQKYIDTLTPKLSGEIYADETELDCQNRKDVFWCSVDWGTRYINATLYSPNPQNLGDATEFLKKIKATVKPKYVQTDGLMLYPRAFARVFNPTRKVYNLETEHRINNYHKTKKHNVRIETVFSKIKDRVYDFRGLKALWSAPILMQGIVIQHNFIEEHTTTGQLPSELAGIKLEIGINKWKGLINLSSFCDSSKYDFPK